MRGTAQKYAGHIAITIYEEDAMSLELGNTLEQITDDNCMIKRLKLKVVEQLTYPSTFIDEGFSVQYYPKTANHNKITTCYVKIDRERFDKLLKKGWIDTRQGSNHLRIAYSKLNL